MNGGGYVERSNVNVEKYRLPDLVDLWYDTLLVSSLTPAWYVQQHTLPILFLPCIRLRNLPWLRLHCPHSTTSSLERTRFRDDQRPQHPGLSRSVTHL